MIPQRGAPEPPRNDPEDILSRWWAALHGEPELADLVAVVPTDRRLGLVDAMGLLPLVLGALEGPERQLAMLDAAARAYVRVAGLHLLEE